MKWRFLLLSVCLFMLAGCGNLQGNLEINSTSNPTPKEILKSNHADIFYLDEIVYSNAEHLDWVKEIEYKLGAEIGEITKVTSNGEDFNHGTANRLPKGTKIYKTNSLVYIAVVNGKEIRYIQLLEG